MKRSGTTPPRTLPLVALCVITLAARAVPQQPSASRSVVDSLARARDSASSHSVTQTTPSGSPATTSGDPALEARVRAVASELRCPVCQGLSIQDSPSELAQEMKAVVREQLAQGRTPEQVKRYFIDRYGEWILLQPRARGFNLAIYVLPLLALAGGLALLALLVRRWTAGRAVFAEDEPDADAVGSPPIRR